MIYNIAGLTSAGIGCQKKMIPEISDNYIAHNQAGHGDGAGIWIGVEFDGMVIRGNTIEYNVAGDHGGGIYFGGLTGTPSVEIAYNVLNANTAEGRRGHRQQWWRNLATRDQRLGSPQHDRSEHRSGWFRSRLRRWDRHLESSRLSADRAEHHRLLHGWRRHSLLRSCHPHHPQQPGLGECRRRRNRHLRRLGIGEREHHRRPALLRTGHRRLHPSRRIPLLSHIRPDRSERSRTLAARAPR